MSNPTAKLGPDPRLNRQIARAVANRFGLDRVDAARFVAGGRIPVKYLNPEQTSTGVVYHVGGAIAGQQSVPHAFGPAIERLRGDVFLRREKSRLPLRRVLGPNLRQLVASGAVDDIVRPIVRRSILDRIRMLFNKTLGIG